MVLEKGSVLVKNIKSNLAACLKSVWLPSELFKNGTRVVDDSIIQLGYGHCYPLRTIDLKLNYDRNDCSDGKNFIIFLILSFVLKQTKINRNLNNIKINLN